MASKTADAAARESKILKIANSIITPFSPAKAKLLINRDNRKEACTLRDPLLGLNLLQIAVIADNVPAGAFRAPLSSRRLNYSAVVKAYSESIV